MPLRVEQLHDRVGLGELRAPRMLVAADSFRRPSGPGPWLSLPVIPGSFARCVQEPVGLARATPARVLTCAAYTQPTTTTANVVATTSSNRTRRAHGARTVYPIPRIV